MSSVSYLNQSYYKPLAVLTDSVWEQGAENNSLFEDTDRARHTDTDGKQQEVLENWIVKIFRFDLFTRVII
jgi:hypothetical protein